MRFSILEYFYLVIFTVSQNNKLQMSQSCANWKLAPFVQIYKRNDNLNFINLFSIVHHS